MIALIPAYKPDIRLIKLVENIKSNCDYKIVIVDDGSGDEYKKIFNRAKELGGTVLEHNVNKGKGRALKTGFEYIKTLDEYDGVVCADSDGQHLVKDIIRVGNSIKYQRSSIILGTRYFTGDVPLKSKIGNIITRKLFSIVSGEKLYDTQTGLRGFSIDMISWLCSIKGERYEYEMNMLMESKSSGYSFFEVPIETVYMEGNKSTHFNPIKDSILIYLPMLKFSISSIISGLMDLFLMIIFQMLTGNLLLSVIGARVLSATFNYSANRFLVFNKNGENGIAKTLPRYILLAAAIVGLNYIVIDFYIHFLSIEIILAKVLTEITIYFISFIAQKKFVFKHSI